MTTSVQGNRPDGRAGFSQACEGNVTLLGRVVYTSVALLLMCHAEWAAAQSGAPNRDGAPVVSTDHFVFYSDFRMNVHDQLLQFAAAGDTVRSACVAALTEPDRGAWQRAVRFYRDIGELFPDLAIVIYHNPENHKFTFPVSAFQKLVQVPNIVGMKDSHRDTRALMQLHQIIGGKISHFVNQLQLHPYYKMGASGCWSTDVWMGPWPILHLWDMVQRGESEEKLQVLCLELSGPGGGGRPDHSLGNKRPQEYASYAKVGPSRVPFLEFPEAVLERARRKAAHWETLCAKYRPIVEAENK